jgi:hypothetical protein
VDGRSSLGVEWAGWPNKGLGMKWSAMVFVMCCINGAWQRVFFVLRLTIVALPCAFGQAQRKPIL